ncbi:MAG TPA: TAXI family TRAP transporter solute-binding subunit [Elusimicrobiota bacterium]|nr:TAXI family TRAP transporter solute-binding subunit [Elusimicrobiota bacterium]
MKANGRRRGWLPAPLAEMFGIDRRAALIACACAAAGSAFAVFWFFHSAPPMALTISSGPAGSSAERNARRYAELLKKSRIQVRVLPSEGSLENLRRLADPAARVDVGFVQTGLADEKTAAKLFSLGSVGQQPLLVFYRGRPIRTLAELSGRRLAIGPEGSGTRALALALLASNEIVPEGRTALLDLEAEAARRELLAGRVDAVFLMGDSAPMEVIRDLLRDRSISLFEFVQADAYVRRFTYLNKITLPRGAIDLGRDIPPRDLTLIGPAVELVARPKLDPALTDLLLDSARDVHGRAGLFRRRGEFPSPQEHELRLSSAAQRFYRSGKSFFYRFLPFWAASLVDRVLVSLVPLLVLLIPGLRAIPAVLRWRINLVLYRWYRMLLRVEHDIGAGLGAEKREAVLEQLAAIEAEINLMSIPVAYATQFYELRGHISFVRNQLAAPASRQGSAP